MPLKTSKAQLLATKNYYQKNKKSIIAKNIAYYQLHKVDILAKKKIRDANNKAKKLIDIPAEVKSLKAWWKKNIHHEFNKGLYSSLDDMLANHPVVLQIKELQSKENPITI